MTGNTTEADLKQAAMRYLKDHYNEDTVSTGVLKNGFEAANGALHVNSTVSAGGSWWGWTKWFTFKQGQVTDLRAKVR